MSAQIQAVPEERAGKKRILAVLVLYKVAAEDSQTFVSLRDLLRENAEAAATIDLIVCDNSPNEQPRPSGFDDMYLSDPSNPGLAKSYNMALEVAKERKLPWLMLLDQDTTLTADYIREVVEQTRSLEADASIAAIIPKLVELYVVLSPHKPPTYRHREFDLNIEGKSESRLCAFNSGSVVRVKALEQVGGFPEEFWLDFLDHATFHQLQAAGGKFFILRSSLRHDLSMADSLKTETVSKQRYANVLDAEFRYYRRYGSAVDQFYRRVRLMRGFLGVLIRRRRLRAALQLLRAAVRI